jgi:hypothetical protein
LDGIKAMKRSTCFSCGARVLDVDGPVHLYMDSSPGCWAAFGTVLEREYTNFDYMRLHGLTVDAYAVQHPGKPSPQCIGSVAIHLASLCQIFERGTTMTESTRFMQRLARHKASFTWLDPPENLGPVTVVNLVVATNAEDHLKFVQEWARSAWAAWEEHHDQVRAWVDLCQ